MPGHRPEQAGTAVKLALWKFRPGGRCDVIVLTHPWKVAKTSAGIARVGSLKPAETPVIWRLRWRTQQALHSACISAAYLTEGRPCPREKGALVGVGRPEFKTGLLTWCGELARSMSSSESLFSHM